MLLIDECEKDKGIEPVFNMQHKSIFKQAKKV